MFHAHDTAGPPAQPPQGVGARVVRRFSEWRAALHNAVARRLRLRQLPRARVASDADNPPALVPERTPRRPRATPSVPPPCPDLLGWLARLSARSRMAAGARQRRERRSGPLTLEEFPGIAPEALAFFNTPMDECDPELLHSVFETFAELIEPAMSGRSRAPDVQDVFRTLSSRLAAVRAEAPEAAAATPPESPASADVSPASPGMSFDPRPETSPEPAKAAMIAATNPQETTSDLPHTPLPQDPARPWDPALPQADAADGIEYAADPDTAAQVQPNAAPAELPSSDHFVNTSAPGAHTPDRSGITPRQPRRALFRGDPSFGMRSFVLPLGKSKFSARSNARFVPRPPRLLCYPACAGPPAILGAPDWCANPGETCTGPPPGGPAMPDSREVTVAIATLRDGARVSVRR